jgi:hypothetical protein
MDREYYVYACVVLSQLVYIGKGKGNRLDHCTSGTSHVYELNRDFFRYGKEAFNVFKVVVYMTEEDALEMEKAAITWYGAECNLYNKIYSNSPEHDCNLELARDFEHFYRIKTDKSYKWGDGSCYDPYEYVEVNYDIIYNRLDDYSPQRPCEI